MHRVLTSNTKATCVCVDRGPYRVCRFLIPPGASASALTAVVKTIPAAAWSPDSGSGGVHLHWSVPSSIGTPENICGIVAPSSTEPQPPFLDEIMARRKATPEEILRLKKAREIKRKRNLLKAAGAGQDKGEDVCAICDDGGDLTCCEGNCHRSFHLDDEHDCIKTLGLTVEEAKNIIEKEDFICKNCWYKQHQCFICGSLGSSDDTDTSSQPEVFQCEHDDCARFYHPKCVAQMLYPDSHHRQELFELHVAAGEGFSCPMHECIVCKEVENKNDKSMRFAICRRCPTVYHRKCLPSDILFEPKKGPKGAMRRAWKNMLPADRILIFCMKHEILRQLQTPARNHIIFPEAHVVETFEAAPMDQDMPEQKETRDHSSPEPQTHSSPEQTPARNRIIIPEANVVKTFQAAPAPMEQDMADQKEASDHSSPEQTHSSPPPAASDQNQCCCSGPLDSFAPSYLFRHPYRGSCGWLDD